MPSKYYLRHRYGNQLLVENKGNCPFKGCGKPLRFRVAAEDAVRTPFRQCRITPFLADLDAEAGAEEVDRTALLQAFRAYLKANELEADWDSVSRAENATLVNALSMMAPYGPAEKQALLEAPDLKTRAETLTAMTEIALARESGDDFPSSLQ